MRTSIPVLALLTVSLTGCAQNPKNMVAYFNVDSCPKGWSDISSSWAGRYVVMSADGVGQVVGEALSPNENRVTGDHIHDGQAFVVDANRDNQSADDDNGRYLRSVTSGAAKPKSEQETVKAGTNAPYVTLRACVKR